METAEARRSGNTRREPRSTASGLGYRPGLDGVRALAVLAVLGYHTGVLRAGWIGVDVFFALSGYLITGLLLGELHSTGTVKLGRFWTRRFRRLLPGVVLLLGFVVVLGGFDLPSWTAPRLDDVLGTFTYSSNWLRVFGERSYWDLFRTPGPLEHVWSLAVEEQFYLVWPVVVWVVGRRRPEWLAAVTFGLLAGTAFAQVWMGTHGVAIERLYVGTDTRAPAFLLGALFVIRFDRGGRPAPWATYTVPVGVAWLLAASVVVDGESPSTYRGVLLAVSLLGAFTVLGAARLPPESVVGQVLQWWPLHRLGRWSYGVYLFHWPVAVALRGQDMLGIQRFVLVTGISVGLAAASYELLEHPIRRAGVPSRWRLPALASSAAILLAACGNVAPEQGRHLDAATRAELLTPLAAPAGLEAAVDEAAPSSPDSDASPGTSTSTVPATTTSPATVPSTTAPPNPATTAPGPTAGTDPSRPPVGVEAAVGVPSEATPELALARSEGSTRLLVLGDSVPFQLAETWTSVAAEREIVVAVRAAPGCNLSTHAADHYRDDTREVCAFAQESLADDLRTFDPAALVVYYGLAGPMVPSEGQSYDVCTEVGRTVLEAQLQRVVGLARDSGAVVFLVMPANPPALDWLDVEAQVEGAACYRSVYESIAGQDRTNVRLLRVDQFLCPTGPTKCPDELDGTEMRYDGIHFSPDGAKVVLRWIHDRLFRPPGL